MSEVLGGDEEHRPKLEPGLRSALILLLGFVGGTAGALIHLALVEWLSPMLNLKMAHEDLWSLLCPLVGLSGAIFTMSRVMHWLERFD